MTSDPQAARTPGEVLLDMRGVRIEGRAEDGWHEIVKGVDLTLRRGEVLGLIGESGAGKSTLGLAAMGFARPGCRIVSGTILFDGIDLMKASEAEKRRLRGLRIAYVAQSAAAAFNPARKLLDQTIESVLRHRLRSPNQARADARQLFATLQLPDPDRIGTRYPHQVSGGQLQRAMTAMAMTVKPDLIVFDEPTTALDVTTQVEVLAAMRSAVDKLSTAAIYITHDLAVVAQMADRIKVLRHGETVEDASTTAMLASPQHPYTKSLWAVRSIEKPEMQSTDIILDMRGVDARYGNVVKVLDDVSIRVPRGRTVAVVGESGSGKSTVARVITGLLPPSKGDVRFNGAILPRTIKERTREELRRIQLIYQSADTAMNPRHTVRDVIGRPIELYFGAHGSVVDKRVGELLEMIELDDSYMDRLPSELSGGQKQRICIARALAAKPDLIICDEVTSSLDQLVQEGILKLLLKLQQELTISYLFISHDIAAVKAVADEIVVMFKGKVVEQGPKSDVLSPPHPAYTELLLSSVPQMDPRWLTDLLARRVRPSAPPGI
ncbi:MAG: ABC transporter ATP-binding protein [Pseudorhodoplanes sp.]